MRTLFVADIQSLTQSARKKYGQGRLNIEYLTRTVRETIGGVDPVRSIAYGVKVNQGSLEFLKLLKYSGFEINYVDPHRYTDRETQEEKILYPSRSVSICMDIARSLPKFDQVILGTAEVQYVDLVKYIKDAGPACIVCSAIVPKLLREISSKWVELKSEILRGDRPDRESKDVPSVDGTS